MKVTEEDIRSELDTLSTLPVTHPGIMDDELTFRFAIIPDRTGGMRAGIFEKAVQRTEWMQPDFVLSVGDLIDGYTEDPSVWNAQWDEFDAIVDRLTIPFYYVPGNHDTSNELLTQVWRERHGRDYYHFVHKNVLFLALNTDEVKNGGIAAPQIDYFRKVLEEHQDVRWTLLFMHRPLWSYGNQAGYEEIENALGDRPYTLFSGHHHHYLYSLKNGREHFVLGTAGGGSYLRGVEFGEFDHITWVTMREEGPSVAHVELSGIHGKELVTDDNKSLIQALRMGTWLKASPVVSFTENSDTLTTRLVMTNTEQVPMRIFGQLHPVHDVRFEPSVIDLIVPPERLAEQEVKMMSTEITGELSADRLNRLGLEVTLQAAFELPESGDGSKNKTSAPPVERSLPATVFVPTDWQHQLRDDDRIVKVDGDLSEWSEDEWFQIDRPYFTREGWDWRGVADGVFEFAVRYTQGKLAVAVRAYDETLLLPERREMMYAEGSAAEDATWVFRDQFFVHVDTDFTVEKMSEFPSRIYNRSHVNPSHFFQVDVGGTREGELILSSNDPARSVEAVFTVVPANLVLQPDWLLPELQQEGNNPQYPWEIRSEMIIDLPELHEKQQSGSSSVLRLNVGWMDHDRPENTKPSMLWWRPGWGFESDFPEAARFQIKKNS